MVAPTGAPVGNQPDVGAVFESSLEGLVKIIATTDFVVVFLILCESSGTGLVGSGRGS